MPGISSNFSASGRRVIWCSRRPCRRVLTRAKIAVFVDGCFWHVCPQHGTLPKNNRDWWREKLDANVARDQKKDEALRRLGWLVLHVWEHESVADAADRIESLWRDRTGRRGVEDASGDHM